MSFIATGANAECPDIFKYPPSIAWTSIMGDYSPDIQKPIDWRKNQQFLGQFRSQQQTGVYAFANLMLGRMNVTHKGFSSVVRNYFQSAIIEGFLRPNRNSNQVSDHNRSIGKMKNVPMYSDYRDLAISVRFPE